MKCTYRLVNCIASVTEIRRPLPTVFVVKTSLVQYITNIQFLIQSRLTRSCFSWKLISFHYRLPFINLIRAYFVRQNLFLSLYIHPGDAIYLACHRLFFPFVLEVYLRTVYPPKLSFKDHYWNIDIALNYSTWLPKASLKRLGRHRSRRPSFYSSRGRGFRY